MENANKITLMLAAPGLKTLTISGIGRSFQSVHRAIYPNKRTLLLGYQANFFVLDDASDKEKYLAIRGLQTAKDIIFQYDIEGVWLGEFSGTWVMCSEFSVEFPGGQQISAKPQFYLKAMSNAIFPGVELIED